MAKRRHWRVSSDGIPNAAATSFAMWENSASVFQFSDELALDLLLIFHGSRRHVLGRNCGSKREDSVNPLSISHCPCRYTKKVDAGGQ